MVKVIQVDLEDRSQVRDFLRLPPRLYRQIPQWVPPLVGDERARLDLKRYPYYRDSAAAFFLAYEGQEVAARLAVLDNRRYNEHNHARTAFFYLFESMADPQAARAIFEAAVAWARGRGLDRLVGPRGFTPLDGLGMLVEGFEFRPALGIPYNPPYYPELVESCGFRAAGEIASGYLSYDYEFPPQIHELSARVQQRRGLHIARFKSRRELRAALGKLKELYNGAAVGMQDIIPLTEPELSAMAGQLLWLADPKLIKIVMKDEQPVGFLLAYPDISAGLQKVKGRLFPFGWLTLLREARRTDWIDINGAGMIEAYQGLGGTAILYSELFKSIKENPRYRHAEVVQIGQENDRMRREMVNFGVNFHKIHRLYHLDL